MLSTHCNCLPGIYCGTHNKAVEAYHARVGPAGHDLISTRGLPTSTEEEGN